MKRILANCLMTALFVVSNVASAQFSAFHDLMLGENATVVDLDPTDEFDFVEAYSGNWTLKLADFHCGQLISNELVDGGSRTTFEGPDLRKLCFQGDSDTPIVIVNFDVSSTVVLWDRADFGQHVIEFTAEFGNSKICWLLIADENNGDQAFGNMFQVNSPSANVCFFEVTLPMFENSIDASLLYSTFEIVIDADASEFGGNGNISDTIETFGQDPVLFGDVNRDEQIDLLDVAPFVDILLSGGYQFEADTNGGGPVDLLDVLPFVNLIIENSGG